MIYLRLFFEFFKTGLFAVGGGLATLPFLYDIADRTGWFTHAQLADMVAISESTPGPIGINMATYVGYVTAGAAGSLVATLGEIAPSVLIGLVVARFLSSFSQNRIVKGAFYGLRPASVGLIAAAGYTVLRMALLDVPLYQATGNLMDLVLLKNLLLAVGIFILMKTVKPHPVIAIAISAVVGVVFSFAGV